MANPLYQYHANPVPPNRPPVSDRNFWILVAILFFIFTPAAVVLTVLKLSGVLDRPSRKNNQGLYGRYGARTTSYEMNTPDQVQKVPSATELTALERKATRLTILGSVFTALGGVATAWALGAELSYGLFSALLAALAPASVLAGGLAVLGIGRYKQKYVRQFRTYLAMIGKRDMVSIASLAAATGTSPKQVRDTLEHMLAAGLFPVGYLDYSKDCLMLSGQAVAEPVQEQESKTEDDPQEQVLKEIQSLSGEIDNPKIAGQVEKIGYITARIFDYQRSHPSESTQLRSFLNYYLPTTLTLLRAYEQLEDQKVHGTNINTTMERIDKMMDKVVDGFEKQLDQLFQGTAMDLTSDIEVLEQMLTKDGLSSSTEFKLEL